jgi:hypothetical protein
MKLTDPQKKLLRELPKRCVDYYAPAKKLVEFGLAEWKKTPVGWDNDFLERTPAGDEALAELTKELVK